MPDGTHGPGDVSAHQTVVLVVEDNDEIRDLLCLVLEEEGHRVLTAGDGAQAVETVHQDRPDLITLDLALPGKDGWEVLRELQDNVETRDIPVLIISAYTREMETSLRQRASGVIPKPFYIAQVATEVSALLKGKKG
jgi:CheY-like chemotaxis protein